MSYPTGKVQYRILTLLGLVAAVAVLIALATPIYRERSAIALLEKKGVQIHRAMPLPRRLYKDSPKIISQSGGIDLSPGIARFTDDELRCIANIRNVRGLSLSDSFVSDRGMELLCIHKELDALFLDNTGVSNNGLQTLLCLSHLKILTLTGMQSIDGSGIQLLASLPELQILDLRFTNLHTVKLIDGFQSLEEIDFQGAATSSVEIGNLPRLRQLHLNEPLEYFRIYNLPALSSIVVTSDNKSSLISFGNNLGSLSGLWIAGGVNADDIDGLNNCESVQRLTFERILPGTHGIRGLESLQRLNEATIGFTGDEGAVCATLRQLVELRQLKNLTLNVLHLTEDIVRALGHSKSLVTVKIIGAEVHLGAAEQFDSLDPIRHIELYQCRLTDSTVQYLSDATHTTDIVLRQSSLSEEQTHALLAKGIKVLDN